MSTCDDQFLFLFSTGIPQLYYFGKCGNIDCMVMELLGANLEDLFELCGGRFTMKTVLQIAFQLLERIELVHSVGLVYRYYLVFSLQLK